MPIATDIREEGDPIRDASRPYGAAAQDENALRALSSIGEGSQLTVPAPARGKGVPPPVLRPLVSPGTPLPYARRREDKDLNLGSGTGGFLASNELSDRALTAFPPAVQAAFRNRKIDRPADTSAIYGDQNIVKGTGGAYFPGAGNIKIGRGTEANTGEADAVNGARHEILHAIQYEGNGFSQDREAGYPELKAALAEALPAIMANPKTTERAREAADVIGKDPDHAFTAIGDLYLQGIPLPHALQAYYDQMQNYRPVGFRVGTTPRETGLTGNVTAAGAGAAMPYGPFAGKTKPGEGVGPKEVGDLAGRYLRAGAAAVERDWDEIAAGFGPAISALIPQPNKPKLERPDQLLRPVGGVVGIVASPFTAAAETGRVTMVQNIPELDAVMRQTLASVPKSEETDPGKIERERVTNEAAAAQAAIDAGRTTLYNAAGQEDLPWETRAAALAGAALLGAETAAEFAAPSIAYRIPAAFRAVARWNLNRTLARSGTLPADEATKLRLEALDQAAQDITAQEARAAEALGVGAEQGPLAAKVAAGKGLSRATAAERAGEQAKAAAGEVSTNQRSSNELLQAGIKEREFRNALVAPEARRNLGDIVNERLRLNAIRSDVLDEAPKVMTVEDEQAIVAGIQATAEAIAPQLEARVQNLGDLMARSARNAERQMFAALRRAMTEGETFRLKNVTVGEDAEGKAVRLRQMVGSFDNAIDSIRSAAAGVGREAQAEDLLIPFLDARKGAVDALQSQEAYNAALKRNAALAVQDYRTASKAATKARLDETRAYQKMTTAGKNVAKAEAGAETQTAKQEQRTEKTVDALQARVDAAKQAAADASESVKMRIGGDKSPQIAHVGTGYVSPDVAEVWQRNRLHTGTFDDPLVGEAMVAWVKQHPGEIDNAEHGWQQFTSSIASLTGADIERVQKMIPKTGELTRTFYVAEQVFGQLVKEWRHTGQMVIDGAATESQLADKTAQVMAFEDALRRGIGEQGRALAARNLVKKADAVQVLAANERVRTSYATVEKLAKQLDNLQGKVAEATAAKDGPLLVKAQARLEAALTELETARDVLSTARADSAAAAEEVYKLALRKAVAQGASKETAAVLAKFDPEDIVPIAAFLRSLKPQGLGALVMRVATAGRYGKLPSQILNFVGTGANVLYQEAAIRPLTRLTAPLASKISGVEKLRAPNETASAWLGVWSATPDAGRFLGRTLWNGKADELALKHGIADYETLIGQGLESGSPVFRIAGHTFELTGPKAIPVDVSLRALYGSDGFWRIMLGTGDRNAAAALKAYRAGEGAKGAVRAVAEKLTIAEREVVHAEGLTKTFNEPILRSGGNIVQQAETHFTHLLGANVGGFAPLRLLIPAARFGMRSVETGLRYSGGGLVSGTRLAVRARDVTLTGEARTALARQGMREMAEGAVGAGLLALGFNFASTGIITGAYPKGESERNRWRTLGIQPMSFKVGDKYIPMGWFGPLAAPFALAALISDGSNEQPDAALADRIERGAQGLGTYVMQQPALYATKNLIDAITSAAEGSVEGMNSLLAQIGTVTSVGALAQSMTPVFDPYQRDPEGLIQRLFSRYPGLSLTVPAKIDQRTGLPAERAVSGPGALLATDIGTARSPEDLTAVERETLAVPIGDLSDSIRSGSATVKLSQDQFKAYEQNARTKANAAAAALIETDTYKTNPDPIGRQAMLKAAYDKAATQAREEMAVSLVSSAKTPDEVYTATIAARASLDEFRYVLTIGSLAADGRLTTDVAKKIDDSRPRQAAGTAALTVAELRDAAPLVQQFMRIKPFLRGDPAEWEQVRTQREEMARIKASQGDAAAATYARSHPLIGMYADGKMSNPARSNFLTSHKAIKSLVGGSDWEWVP